MNTGEIDTPKSGYKLTRPLFDFAFDNKECNVYHIALFTWMVELNNRFGWKKEFGLPSSVTMEGLSIGNKRTYLSALRDLEKWGFIKIISEAKNQYQSCIIELCHSNIASALVPALDTSLLQHSHSVTNSIAPIDKPINTKPLKPINNKIIDFDSVFNNPEFLDCSEDLVFVFKKWIDHKKAINEKYKSIDSVIAAFKNLKKISGEKFQVAEEIINNSIANQWKGLFPLKTPAASRAAPDTTSKAQSLYSQNVAVNFTND
jgi:hypothetical protein